MMDNYEYRRKFDSSVINDMVDKICKRYFLAYGYVVKVTDIREMSDGISFLDRGIQVASLPGDSSTLNYPVGVIEKLQKRERDERQARVEARREKAKARKRKFVLTKVVPVGFALTATAILTLNSLGVIKISNNVDSPTVVAVQSESGMSINEANDLILVEWANYVMSGADDKLGSSEYESARNTRDSIYNSYFVPVMSSYYTYIDNVDSGLPIEIEAYEDSLENSHDNFRNYAYVLNDAIAEKYLSEYCFEASPFTNATVVNNNGEEVSDYGRYDGELASSSGDVLSADDYDEYNVYVRAVDVGYNEVSSLPDDAIIIDGETYVMSSHLYDEEKSVEKSF